MMSAEITRCVSMPRRARPGRQLEVPLPGQAASAVLCLRVPWVAVTGSQARPVVMTACNCRKIAAAMTVWAGLARACSAPCWSGTGTGRCRPGWRAGLPRPRARRQPQPGSSLAGQPGPAGERAGQFLPRRQTRVLHQRPSGREPLRVTGPGHDRRRAHSGQAGDRGGQRSQASWSTTPVIRCSASASRALVSSQSSSSNCTRSSTPGRCAVTPAGSPRAANSPRTIRKQGFCLPPRVISRRTACPDLAAPSPGPGEVPAVPPGDHQKPRDPGSRPERLPSGVQRGRPRALQQSHSLGLDQSQVRLATAIARHTVLVMADHLRRHRRPAPPAHQHPGATTSPARPAAPSRPGHDCADRPGNRTAAHPARPARPGRVLAGLETTPPGTRPLVPPSHTTRPRRRNRPGQLANRGCPTWGGGGYRGRAACTPTIAARSQG